MLQRRMAGRYHAGAAAPRRGAPGGAVGERTPGWRTLAAMENHASYPGRSTPLPASKPPRRRAARTAAVAAAVAALALAASTPARAGGAAAPAIASISFRLISTADGSLGSLDAPPSVTGNEPYGFDLEVLVGVTFTTGARKPGDLVLTVTAPGFDTEVTGKVPPLKEKHKRRVLPAEGRTVYFVVAYSCYTDAKVTATFGKARASAPLSMPCAE